MPNEFKGTGNLGKTPELKYIENKDGQRAVANFSIRFNRDKRQENGEYVDNGGFWLDTAVFGPQAERVAKVLSKGARVYAEGSLKQQTWEKDGEQFSKLVLEASYVAPDLLGIESISYHSKESKAQPSSSQTTSSQTQAESNADFDYENEADF